MIRNSKRTLVLCLILVLSSVILLFFRHSNQHARPDKGTSAPLSGTWDLSRAARPYRGETIHLIGEDYPPMQAIEKLKSTFEDQTGIHVDVERYEAEAVLQKVAFDLNSKAGHYDLLVQVYFDMGRMASQGQLRPMEPFLSNPALREPNFQPDQDFFPVWRTMGEYGGHQYGYPMMVLTMYTWYRKDLFDDPKEQAAFRARYGYNLTAPDNWKQYRDIAEFFDRPDQGLYGTLVQGKKHIALWQEYLNFLYSFGGSVMDTADASHYGPIEINSPAAVRATEFYKSLLKYSPPDTLNFTWDDALALMQQGKVAECLMWTDSTYALEDPKQSKVVGKMGYAMMPKGPAGIIHQIGGQSYYIPTTSKHQEAAYLFMQWMLGSQNQIAQQQLGGASARISTYSDPRVLALPWTATSIAALNHTHPAMLSTVPESLQIGEVIESAISDILADRRPVREGLNWAAQQINKVTRGKATLKYQ